MVSIVALIDEYQMLGVHILLNLIFRSSLQCAGCVNICLCILCSLSEGFLLLFILPVLHSLKERIVVHLGFSFSHSNMVHVGASLLWPPLYTLGACDQCYYWHERLQYHGPGFCIDRPTTKWHASWLPFNGRRCSRYFSSFHHPVRSP